MADNVKKVVCEIDGAILKVVAAVSKAGNVYHLFQVEIDGKEFDIGFVNDSHKLALLRAGYDVE